MIQLEVVNEKPPIYEEAHKHFEIDDQETIYTYGRKIYNPGNINVDEFLMVHEVEHASQQEAIGGSEIWWKQYFDDPVFRASQEAQAYGAQYRHFCRVYRDRNRQNQYLIILCRYLSSGLYNVGMKASDAMMLIKNNAK